MVKRLKGVVRGFLGKYSSRYTAYRGYWLFGFLADGRVPLEIDLLGGVGAGWTFDDSPAEAARLRAVDAFRDQCGKLYIPDKAVADARLSITVAPDVIDGLAGGSRRSGRLMTLAVTVVADTGRTFAGAHTMFVAPHDPVFESASAGPTDPSP